MKRKTILGLLVVLVASLFMVAAAQSATSLVRLTIYNRTGKTLRVALRGTYDYYLPVPPGTKTFTVERDEYHVSYVLCNNRINEVWDVTYPYSAIISGCYGSKDAKATPEYSPSGKKRVAVPVWWK